MDVGSACLLESEHIAGYVAVDRSRDPRAEHPLREWSPAVILTSSRRDLGGFDQVVDAENDAWLSRTRRMSTSRFVEELPAASRTWAVLFGSAGTNWTMLFPSRPIPWIASISYIGHRLDRAQVTQTRRHGGRTPDSWQALSSIEKRRHEIVMGTVGQARSGQRRIR